MTSVSALCHHLGEGSLGRGEFPGKQRPLPGEGGRPSAEDVASVHRGVAFAGGKGVCLLLCVNL